MSKREREIKFITNDAKRAKCLRRRIVNLKKKVLDLHTLTGVKVIIIINKADEGMRYTSDSEGSDAQSPLEDSPIKEDDGTWKELLNMRLPLKNQKLDLKCDEAIELTCDEVTELIE